MGIDAEMYVLVSREQATPEKLRAANHALYSAFGPGRFFREPLTLTLERYRDDGDPEPGTLIRQDGPDEPAPEGKLWVEAHLWTRYYGVGYERGDYAFIYVLARMLEHVFPGGSVWYGGDSSGVVATPFDHPERERLLLHWMDQRNDPYVRRFGGSDGPKCSRCGVSMPQFGWGPQYAAWRCVCGEDVTKRGDVTEVSTIESRRAEIGTARRELLERASKLSPELGALANKALSSWEDG